MVTSGFCKRTRRRTAMAMLLIWSFAFVSGVANACLLETSIHDHPSAQVQVRPLPGLQLAPDTTAHRHDVLDHHDSQTGSPKPSCLKSCDDGSRALVKQLVGSDLADPGSAPFTVVNWAAVTPLAAWLSLQSIDLPPRSVGPPIRHRFSRLTL